MSHFDPVRLAIVGAGCSTGVMDYQPVTEAEFSDMADLGDWKYAVGGIHAAFEAGSYPHASELVAAITVAAEGQVHHPNIDIRYPGQVFVSLTTHAVGGLTTRDTTLAGEISRLAALAGATPNTASIRPCR